MNLRVKNLRMIGKEKEEVKKIYYEAFPKEDRMPYWLMVLLAQTKNTELLVFSDEEKVCGFVYLAAVRKVCFIMFLAVDQKLQSKGYGSYILEKVQSLHKDCKIIVSIERCCEDVPDLDIRVRRKEFYFKNGFEETGYLLEMKKIQQEILIENGVFSKEEFASFFIQYSNGTIHPKIFREDN